MQNGGTEGAPRGDGPSLKIKETIFTFEQARYCQNFTHIPKMISKISIC